VLISVIRERRRVIQRVVWETRLGSPAAPADQLTHNTLIHMDFILYDNGVTEARHAGLRHCQKSSPGRDWRVARGVSAANDNSKQRRFTLSRGTQASLLAYFAPIANVRLDLSAFMHCGSSAEPKAIR
jgi:hypothetical protein